MGLIQDGNLVIDLGAVARTVFFPVRFSLGLASVAVALTGVGYLVLRKAGGFGVRYKVDKTVGKELAEGGLTSGTREVPVTIRRGWVRWLLGARREKKHTITLLYPWKDVLPTGERPIPFLDGKPLSDKQWRRILMSSYTQEVKQALS